jgi:hypothetical protein
LRLNKFVIYPETPLTHIKTFQFFLDILESTNPSANIIESVSPNILTPEILGNYFGFDQNYNLLTEQTNTINTTPTIFSNNFGMHLDHPENFENFFNPNTPITSIPPTEMLLLEDVNIFDGSDSEGMNENGEVEENGSDSTSTGCSDHEIGDIQMALNNLVVLGDDSDDSSSLPDQNYENTKEEDLLCSFAVQKNLSRDVMEDLLAMLTKPDFMLEHITVNYRKMRSAWTGQRPLKKYTIKIATVQKTKLGKKKGKKQREQFSAFNPDIHDLSQKIDVNIFFINLTNTINLIDLVYLLLSKKYFNQIFNISSWKVFSYSIFHS